MGRPSSSNPDVLISNSARLAGIRRFLEIYPEFTDKVHLCGFDQGVFKGWIHCGHLIPAHVLPHLELIHAFGFNRWLAMHGKGTNRGTKRVSMRRNQLSTKEKGGGTH